MRAAGRERRVRPRPALARAARRAHGGQAGEEAEDSAGRSSCFGELYDDSLARESSQALRCCMTRSCLHCAALCVAGQRAPLRPAHRNGLPGGGDAGFAAAARASSAKWSADAAAPGGEDAKPLAEGGEPAPAPVGGRMLPGPAAAQGDAATDAGGGGVAAPAPTGATGGSDSNTSAVERGGDSVARRSRSAASASGEGTPTGAAGGGGA